MLLQNELDCLRRSLDLMSSHLFGKASFSIEESAYRINSHLPRPSTFVWC
uniref:Uncharacterized protein n=1 Tax=Anguilla anguilla TaxID=7936 RepID=A0A0E9RZJ2_ANGAN